MTLASAAIYKLRSVGPGYTDECFKTVPIFLWKNGEPVRLRLKGQSSQDLSMLLKKDEELEGAEAGLIQGYQQ